MATGSMPLERSRVQSDAASAVGPREILNFILRPLASMRLTVAMFAASIFLVFVGTLAQVEKDMWEVMGQYFESWVAYIELQVFFPRSWFPSWQNVPGGFVFLGGKTIGLAMFVNLLAAHLRTFTIQTRGTRLWTGLAVMAVGATLTALVIISGHNQDGLQGSAPFSWRTLWLLVGLAVIPLWLVSLGAAIGWPPGLVPTHWRESVLIRRGLYVIAGLLTIPVGWIWIGGDRAYLGDSAMRILWQLTQGGLAAAVLLAGCILVFKKRGGVVLLHGGIGLLMIGQLFVSVYDKEEQITLVEKEQVNFARDIRSVELAVIDKSDAKLDRVVAIPLTVKGQRTRRLERLLQHEALPFDLRVVKYFRNSDLRSAKPGEENLATAGEGKFIIAEERRGSAGAAMNSEVDMAAAYITILKKGTTEELGTYMLAQEAEVPEQVTVEGKKFDLFLRFSRAYKPYAVELLEVRKDDYIGTDTPRNYSSDVRLIDSSRNVDTKAHIWMNNPLRYAGETFYQSGYRRLDDGAEATTLQVVRNTGWMIPYVSCMLVGVGMLAHFSVVLLRFLHRVPEPISGIGEWEGELPAAGTGKKGKPSGKPGKGRTSTAPPAASNSSFSGWVMPAIVVGFFAIYVGMRLAPRSAPDGDFDLKAFGQLPVLYQGRAKPFDTLARNSLQLISDKESVSAEEGGKSTPAIRWLLDIISGSEAGEEHKVFRIPNLEVLEVLGLERRPGFRYSAAELRSGIADFEVQVQQAREFSRTNDADKMDIRQRKLLELDDRIRVYTMLLAAFRPPQLPPLPTPEEFEKDRPAAQRKIQDFQRILVSSLEQLSSIKPPLAVPVKSPQDDEKVDWQPYARAWAMAFTQARLLGEDPDPATVSLNSILAAYARGDAKTFNKEVAKYRDDLAKASPPEVHLGKIRFEEAFNRFSPFVVCKVMYVCVFILASLGLLGWLLGWARPFNRAAFWLAVFTLLVHTLALAGRIYISGRPPVTNLYSSAVFIGWACVLFFLVLEIIFRLGVGNLLASISGFCTLLVAYYLSFDGDTFTVLQAVLDTQFWLATHVVCITIGYATTFVAGLLGIAYILTGVFTPYLSVSVQKWQLNKLFTTMIYGVVCFSIFFSFIGTVLGGLWADDSWGRFWGWDPKENGALIIVLWNALILHARWGALIRERGLAVLAVVGNIVTSWSWFGVNELGVGLHSYGFTEGVLLSLGLFVLSQLVIVGIGLLPRAMWASVRAGNTPLGAET